MTRRSAPTVLKILIALSFLSLFGLPFLELWKMIILLISWIALAYSDLRVNTKRIVCSLLLILLIVSIRIFFPPATLEEGHNIFLITENENILQQRLPAPIFEKWRQAFEKQYPLNDHPKAEWRHIPPKTFFAHSSDALWRPAKYSRQVETIAFNNLSEFRGGFANEARYGFFGQDPISMTRSFKADLPFFVMLEFSQPFVGSTLFWKGNAFWEKTDGTYEEIVHEKETDRMILAKDVGKKLFALHLPAPITLRPWERKQNTNDQRHLASLSMHLKLSPSLVISLIVRHLLSLMGILGILFFLTRIQWRAFLISAGIISIGLIFIGITIHFSEGKYLGSTYPPHGGGDDGITHDSLGRDIARNLMSGNWKEALRGGQSIYWDTPGMRYARAIEKILFGDTNLGYTAFLGLLPWIIYLYIHLIAGVRWAMAIFLLFIISPIGSLSFLQYVQNAKLGYAEAMGFGFFILGFYLFVYSQSKWAGESGGLIAFLGGISLAGSMFLRPNLAIAVPLLGLFFIVTCWRSRKFWVMTASMTGLAFALWMPLHNYLYGHQFVLISLAGSTISVPMSPWSYIKALLEFISGNYNGNHIIEVSKQLSGWLWTLPRLPTPSLKIIAEGFMVLKLITLAITIFTAFNFRRIGSHVLILSWIALASHLPMLFIFASGQFRYGMIAWDLSALVTILVIAQFVKHSSTDFSYYSPR